MRGLKMEDKLGRMVRGMDGKPLPHAVLTGSNESIPAPRIIPHDVVADIRADKIRRIR